MEEDQEDVHQHSRSGQPQPRSAAGGSQQALNREPAYSPFEFDDYYNYRASGMDYAQYYGNPDYYQNFSDSNSDDDGPSQNADGTYTYNVDGAGNSHSRPSYGDHFDSEGAYSRFGHNSNSEEEDGKERKVALVDPGPFLYNKRVFITALPCLLLTLVMTGETLLLMVAIGGLLIVLMAQAGGEVSKRCVVVFSLQFIPCHIVVVGTVLPLLWLTLWNLLLVVIINFFSLLTGSWVILQFEAFRMEEPSMCAMIERALFSLYPCMCSALVTWVLSTVVSPPFTSFFFVCIWFVCLQLYLLPAAPSFKQTDSKEEKELTVLSQPTVMALVLAFCLSGPALQTVLTMAGYCALKFWSLPSLVLLAMLACLGLFLATLLNLRQLCDHFGWRHSVVVQLRWGSGAGMLLLCYPVLHQQGILSHVLLSLPLAVAGFTALAFTLSFHKGKMMPLVLMAMLMLLLFLWLNHLPWGLTYYFLGSISLRNFYGLVAANFCVCVIIIYSSWNNSSGVFSCLLLVQCLGLTVCELGLYQAGLYSLPAFQLTGVLAAYTLHRLYLAGKLKRGVAALTCAVQLTKTAVGVVSYVLLREGEEDLKEGVVEITSADFLTVLPLVGVVVWLFVYESAEEITPWQAGKHITTMMVSLGVSGQSFLLPLGDFLLQGDLTLADLVGLWYGLGGVLILLYALQHRQSEGLMDQLMKVAVVMGGVGALVTVMQPQFLLTFQALTQWSEVLSVLLIAALLATSVPMSWTNIFLTSAVLGISPGIHGALLLYGELVTVLHFVFVSALFCHLLVLVFITVKTEEVGETLEKVICIGAVLILCLLTGVLCVDLINFEPMDSVWDYPAWMVLLAVTAAVSLCLKLLAVRLGSHHLPLTKKEYHRLPLIPIISNIFTVSAFLLAGAQGPFDTLLHDLWFCAASLFLLCLQCDSFLLSSLSPANRATPTVVAALGILVLSTLMQSQLWGLEDVGGVLLGLLEMLVVLASLPVYVVLVGLQWHGQIWSEKAVVFTMPLNALLLLLGTSYTAWVLCGAGFLCGLGMMILRLPLLPKNFEPIQR